LDYNQIVKKSKVLIALTGNPNVGKSTVFNALAGEHQHTGNWPGKTIEKAEGHLSYKDKKITVVDLPGTYSLSAHSPEEVIARDFIIQGEPDVVIIIVDATLLERNLNLTLQILEITNKVVIALNFMDEVQQQGFTIDISTLEKKLRVPVIPTIAKEGTGIDELLHKTIAVSEEKIKTNPIQVNYGLTLERAIYKLEREIYSIGIDGRSKWLALKLLEDDVEISSAFRSNRLPSSIMVSEDSIKKSAKPDVKSTLSLTKIFDMAQLLGEKMTPDSRIEIVRRRYATCHEIAHKTIRRLYKERVTLTEKLDRIVTHRFWAWPIMFAVFLAIFWITIEGSSAPSNMLAYWFNLVAYNGKLLLESLNVPWWIIGLLIDGLVFGIGTVIAVMLPPMVIFFVLFALMEDFGFIPRVAFNLDKVMQALGSQGKQCLTGMMSYGCNVVGVMSSRIISNEKDRLISIITSPLIICNGRFGPGIALAILFFGNHALWVMFSLIIISLAAYFLVTFILNKIFFRHESSVFMMELPPYRRPQIAKVIWRTLADRVTHVMVRAILIAAPAVLLIWLMGNMPQGQPFENTAIGILVNSLAPLGQKLGLDGEMLTALLFSLPAKEIVIPSLAMTYGLQTSLMESENVFAFISGSWSFLSAYAFLVFYMLYLPCLVTVWAIWKETRSLKWTMLSFITSLITAILITALIYSIGSILIF